MKLLHVAVTISKKYASLAAIAMYTTIIYTVGYLQISTQATSLQVSIAAIFKERSIVMVFNETPRAATS